MGDTPQRETIQKLLHDYRFTAWHIAPTEELDAFWHSWMEEHPDERPAVEQARNILCSLRLNDYTISEEKSEQLWQRLQHSMQANRIKRRRMIFRNAAACAAVVLLGVAGWLWQANGLLEDNLVDATPLFEELQTEVTLISDSRDTLWVEDNTLIAYQADIAVETQTNERIITPQTHTVEGENVEMNTLIVPRGRRSSLLLEDGSKIWVNSGSKLHFPSHFDASHRSIEVEGEAYIEVAKSEIPFYVKTNDFTVNVLGTKFNVTAYKEEKERSVVLAEGSVQVETSVYEKIVLSPDQKLTLAEDGKSIEQVNVYDYISWKDGILQFNGETMGNILSRLSRYYNVPIKYQAGIEQRRSSGKLVLFEDIHQVMETFSILYDTHYRIESETLFIE